MQLYFNLELGHPRRSTLDTSRLMLYLGSRGNLGIEGYVRDFRE